MPGVYLDIAETSPNKTHRARNCGFKEPPASNIEWNGCVWLQSFHDGQCRSVQRYLPDRGDFETRSPGVEKILTNVKLGPPGCPAGAAQLSKERRPPTISNLVCRKGFVSCGRYNRKKIRRSASDLALAQIASTYRRIFG